MFVQLSCYIYKPPGNGEPIHRSKLKPPRWNGHVRRLQMARFRSKPWAGWSVVVGRVSSFTCMKLGYMVEYTTKLVRRKKRVYWATKECHLKIVYLVDSTACTQWKLMKYWISDLLEMTQSCEEERTSRE